MRSNSGNRAKWSGNGTYSGSKAKGSIRNISTTSKDVIEPLNNKQNITVFSLRLVKVGIVAIARCSLTSFLAELQW